MGLWKIEINHLSIAFCNVPDSQLTTVYYKHMTQLIKFFRINVIVDGLPLQINLISENLYKPVIDSDTKWNNVVIVGFFIFM